MQAVSHLVPRGRDQCGDLGAGVREALLRFIDAPHFKPVLTAYYPLPDLRVYDLRHTFATNMLAEGVSPLTVAKMMGHASTVMVLTVYGHVLEGQEEEATAKVGARFAPAREV